MGTKRHIIVSPETDEKIEFLRRKMAEEGVSVSKAAIVAIAISEKAGRSGKK